MNWLWLIIGWLLAVGWLYTEVSPVAGLVAVLCTIGWYVMKWTLQLVLGVDQHKSS